MQNIPAFKKKNESKGNIGKADLGIDLQAAYSITDKFGVMLNGMYYANNTSDDNYKTPGKGFGVELGGGYFKRYNNFILESYGLIGLVKFENGQGILNGQLFQPYGGLTTNLSRIAIQPSVTYSKKIFEVSLSSRLSYLNYFNISKEPYIFNDVDLANNLIVKNNYLFFEPALTIRIGLKNAKLQFQTQKAFLLNRNNDSDYQYWNDSSFLGLFFQI